MNAVLGRADEHISHWRDLQTAEPLGGVLAIDRLDGSSARAYTKLEDPIFLRVHNPDSSETEEVLVLHSD
ncbi:MAG TPA: hypothetical protein VGE59_01400 [Patescibacteria group bacterium]